MKIPILILSVHLLSVGLAAANPPKIATLEEALDAKEDLWGIAAMQQTNGASYEFFTNLLPPLRYVNAQFRHYPIVLCAPGALQKARLVSNGSAINARAALPTWYEVGTPVSFLVGAEQVPFGEKLNALDGPRYDGGYLPIVQMNYRSGNATYHEETFASVEFTNHAVMFTQFSLKDGKSGTVSARIGSSGSLHSRDNSILDEKGRALVFFDKAWQWNGEQRTLSAQLSSRTKATLAIATVPFDSATNPPLSAFHFDAQKKKCAARWESLLAGAMRVEVPEPIVNAAWKSTIVGNFLLLRGNDINYSAGNIYETMYEAESGDAARALLLWGLRDEGRRMIPPLLDYGVNKGLRFHHRCPVSELG